MRQRVPVIALRQHGPGFGGDTVTALGRQAHATIDGEAGTIEHKALVSQDPVHFRQRGGGAGDIVHADVRVVHDLAVLHRLALVLELGLDTELLHKSGLTDVDLARQVYRVATQSIEIWQSCPRQL